VSDETRDGSPDCACTKTTFGCGTHPSGPAEWTAFMRGFLARTLARLAEASASVEQSLGSGQRLCVWPVSFDRVTSSWRTQQLSLDGALTLYSETWPRSGSMRNGACYPRPQLALRIVENGGGVWQRGERTIPTPRNNDARKGCDFDAQCPRNGLAGYAKMVPTPRAEDSQQTGAHRGSPDTLTSFIRMWPTPRAANPGSRLNCKGGKILQEEVEIAEGLRHRCKQKWPTPRASTGGPDSKRAMTDGATGPRLQATVGGALNPTWVEWLMGWPLGYSVLSASGMVRFRSARLRRGRCSQDG
jgi:DNA (cytosine-5)-methyltransferase 1